MKQKHPGAVMLGRLAAKKNKQKGSDYFKELGKKGAKARWGKVKKQAKNKDGNTA